MRTNSLSSLSLILAMLSLTACGSDRVSGVRTPQYDHRSNSVAANSAASCAFSITEITDKRDSTDLGAIGKTAIDGKDFINWVTSGLKSIPGYTTESAPLNLRVEVLKGYAFGLSSMKSANIVLRVHTAKANRPETNKVYRGADSSMNWANGESEIQSAFERALTEARQQIIKDLPTYCAN